MAPAFIPQESNAEADAPRDRTRGYVILLDPEAAEMEAQLHAGARWAQALLNLLLIAAAISGAACLISQTMKWIAV